MPIPYENVLPYLPVQIPTSEEINVCDRLELTSTFNWDPYTKEGLFLFLETDIYKDTQIPALDPISDELISCKLSLIAYNLPLLHYYSVPNAVLSLDSEPEEFISIHAIKSSNKYTITPEMLSKM